MEGFSYCGTHCSEFGIRYIPSAENRMLNMPDFTQSEETVTNRDGSYYYGEQAKPREFTVECFFQGITMDTFERMTQWISRKTYGELIFDDRPFVYYMAKPMKKPSAKVYSFVGPSGEQLYEGTITFYFKAFDPHGFMKYITYSGEDVDHAEEHCGIIEESMMPDAPDVTTRDFLVYNPGTEKCPMTIRIGGTAPNGLTIENLTNGDVCKIKSLPPSGYLEIDGKAGKVSNLGAGFDGLAFEMHDEGYITLEPCVPYSRILSPGNLNREWETFYIGEGEASPSNVFELYGSRLSPESGANNTQRTSLEMFGDKNIEIFDLLELSTLSGCDKKIIIDGSNDEEYEVRSAENSGYYYFCIKNTDDVVGPNNDYTVKNLYCDTLPATPLGGASGVLSGLISGVGSSTGGGLYISIPEIKTIEDLRSYLSSSPITIWYRTRSYEPDLNIHFNKITKNWSLYTFTGDEVFVPSFNGFVSNIFAGSIYCPASNSIPDLLCTHFASCEYGDGTLGQNKIAVTDSGTLCITYGNYANATDAEDIKAFLKEQYRRGTPVKVLYRRYSPLYFAYEIVSTNMFVATHDLFTDDHVGCYIWIKDKWHKILHVKSSTEIVIDENVFISSNEKCRLSSLNHISITGDNINLNKLEIEYTPMLR